MSSERPRYKLKQLFQLYPGLHHGDLFSHLLIAGAIKMSWPDDHVCIPPEMEVSSVYFTLEDEAAVRRACVLDLLSSVEC